MANTTDQFLDLTIIRQLALERFKSGIDKEINRLFVNISRRIRKELANADELTEYKKRRLNDQINSLMALINYEVPDYTELAVVEAAWVQSAVGATIATTTKLPPRETIERIANASLVQGAPVSEWFKKLEADTRFQIERTVKTGVAQGLTNREITTELIGKANEGAKGGQVLKKARREVQSVTRTAVQAVANDVRLASYREMSDLIRGLEHSSTLDSRTTLVCAARDGMIWDLNGNPLDGTDLPFALPPLHFNCRSTLVPVTKTFREMGIDRDEIAEGTRASEFGQVSAQTKFKEYLRERGPEFQRKVLGAGRFELYDSGKITLNQLLDSNGLRPLSIEELSNIGLMG